MTVPPFDDPTFALNRRAFLGRYAGGTRLAGAGAPAGGRAPAAGADPLAAEPAPRRAGEGGHLPVPARRAEPDGPVRPQAGADTSSTASRIPGKLEVHFHTQQGKLLASPFRFRPRGRVRAWSCRELLPHTAGIADDITLVRSMTTDSVDHEAALRLIHTGKIFAGRPTWGSWVRLRPGHGATRTCRPTSSSPIPAGCRSTASDNWSSRLPAGGLSGHAVPRRRHAGRSTSHARRRARPRPARNQLDFLDELNRVHLPPPPGQRRAGGADRQLTSWPPDADRRAGRARPLERDGGDAAAVRPRQPDDRASTASAACWPAGWSSGACASCRSSSAASRGTRTSKNAETARRTCAP